MGFSLLVVEHIRGSYAYGVYCITLLFSQNVIMNIFKPTVTLKELNQQICLYPSSKVYLKHYLKLLSHISIHPIFNAFQLVSTLNNLGLSPECFSMHISMVWIIYISFLLEDIWSENARILSRLSDKFWQVQLLGSANPSETWNHQPRQYLFSNQLHWLPWPHKTFFRFF